MFVKQIQEMITTRPIKALHHCLLALAISSASGLMQVTPTLHRPSLRRRQGALTTITTRLFHSTDSRDKHDDNINNSNSKETNSNNSILVRLWRNFRTASSEGFGTRARNVASTCQVGDIGESSCVPIMAMMTTMDI